MIGLIRPAAGKITVLGMDFGSYLSGSVLTESIFGWPGLGQLAVGSAATLLLLQPDNGLLRDVCCRGRWLLRDGKPGLV